VVARHWLVADRLDGTCHGTEDTAGYATIDPVAMNVVNRVAVGGKLHGELEFNGGLLVQE
jgi:hypothetical protein